MTIRLPHELAQFIEDAVSAGLYASENDVIKDALVRLQKAVEGSPAEPAPGGEPAAPEKPLTKQKLQRHLAEIGLVDRSVDISADEAQPNAPMVEEQGEVISDMVIRERLIEWLAGFL
jgi:Arc/MetJ-type ribon-helix-helix transcriptional regulator